ncbi:unnamed protein product [Closterium sp. NIES-64]|nr:unnamed protein product [Closterium sp. NIES-64]
MAAVTMQASVATRSPYLSLPSRPRFASGARLARPPAVNARIVVNARASCDQPEAASPLRSSLVSQSSTQASIDQFSPQQLAINASTISSTAAAFLAPLALLAAPAVAAESVGQTDEEFVESLIYWGITAVIYLFVAPPLVYGYLRLRWFNRSTIETFFQYYLMFAFFPAMLLWSPFINFRRLPRKEL